MSMFHSFNISASGMSAERYRMDIMAENLANANTTRTKDGTQYRRMVVTFEERPENARTFSSFLGSASSRFQGQGVRVGKVVEDTWTQMNMVYDPAHPDADENGYVTYSNVNSITEMTNLIDASRAYEANATAFNASKSIAMKGLEMAQ